MPDFYLVDTNVLLRRARQTDSLQPIARRAISKLVRQRARLCITSQNVIEYWSALTRPVEKNGFGLSPLQADLEARQLENFFRLLPETPAIYRHWRKLVVDHGVSGVQVHDARLVAVMVSHGVTHLLTFNTDDFNRFTEVTATNPKEM